jgi:hypothetical protein
MGLMVYLFLIGLIVICSIDVAKEESSVALMIKGYNSNNYLLE